MKWLCVKANQLIIQTNTLSPPLYLVFHSVPPSLCFLHLTSCLHLYISPVFLLSSLLHFLFHFLYGALPLLLLIIPYLHFSQCVATEVAQIHSFSLLCCWKAMEKTVNQPLSQMDRHLVVFWFSESMCLLVIKILCNKKT